MYDDSTSLKASLLEKSTAAAANTTTTTTTKADDIKDAQQQKTTPLRESDRGVAWLHAPTIPLTLSYFLGVRGGENVHLYLWILKDLSWTQEWFYPAWVFGTLAVVWAFYLLSHAVYEGATNEIFTRFAVTIWIFANWWWITGEVHDWNYPDEPPLYDERTVQASYILDAGLCWLGIFYLIVKPLKLLDADNPVQLRRYDGTGLPARFPFLFPTWREYENAHILFWMAKDCAWANNVPAMWIFFTVPTVGMAYDFVWVSLFRKHLLVDHAHYVSILLWVTANSVWAGGEFFDLEYDYPYSLGSTDPEARLTPRWYSAWLLVVAFPPISIMYGLWTYHTWTDACKGSDDPEFEDHHSPDDMCRACMLDHTPDADSCF